jgi:hypothetical protein
LAQDGRIFPLRLARQRGNYQQGNPNQSPEKSAHSAFVLPNCTTKSSLNRRSI